ncbi:hypothetical protein F5B22DRAFT_638578 [Xylaria bambusicola]|uniref:uncharacterized protein n=1 Tax=Xylaria bambusicola TaxID=326684 RepID=UPI0020089F96|nr:uncharacterized protein F5B22DRAFT_638578 [Xylaria bambusicola]KAI0508716.1 hypothetical protein F5B22DRAFT_638578 [Xylaria bambusicola]
MGTVLLTGANGSIGLHVTEELLKTSPELTLVLTVRQTEDKNTARLNDVISKYTNAKTFIHKLDLADLSAVHSFTGKILSSVASGQLPHIGVIICNAMYWNLVSDPEITVDGYDKTFQVGHIAHVALVLRLLGSFDKSIGGRVVLMSSQNHYPGKSQMEKIPPKIPSDMSKLVHTSPADDSHVDHNARGFEIYSNMKLAAVAWMHALNQHLEKDPALQKITVVAIDPGVICDSRAFTTNTPSSIINMQKYVLRPFSPLCRLVGIKGFRTSAQAAVDVAQLAINRAQPNARGYFTLLNKDATAPQSLEREIQQRHPSMCNG